MTNRFKQLFVSHWIKIVQNQQGAAALTVLLIVMAVTLIVVSTTSLIGLDNLSTGFSQQVSSSLVLSAESCVEEARLRLSRDNTYSGGTLSVGDMQCAILVTGTPCGSCTIDVEASANQFVRKIRSQVTVTGSNVNVTSWQEVE